MNIETFALPSVHLVGTIYISTVSTSENLLKSCGHSVFKSNKISIFVENEEDSDY